MFDSRCGRLGRGLQFENGDFENAVKYQKKAANLAEGKDKENYTANLKKYKAGKPYRE